MTQPGQREQQAARNQYSVDRRDGHCVSVRPYRAGAGVHCGYADTDIVRHVEWPKARPQDIAAVILDGIEADRTEILADDAAVAIKAACPAR